MSVASNIQLDLDMIRYNEVLNKCSTRRITKHEEALLHKFPYSSKQLLDKPLVLVDSGGCIILWYLPDTISLWIQVRLCIVTYEPTFTLSQQAKMEEATVSMGYLLKKSMTSGQQTKWRTFSGYFHMSDCRPLTPGCINIAPCWFQQGQEYLTAQLSSVTGNALFTEIQDLLLKGLIIQLQYNSGAMVGCSGHIVRHGVTFTGDWIVWTWFMRDSLHNFVGTPQPQYVKYMDVDWDVLVSA
ncbi:hypothetical protein DFH29DRAFT_881794 [Suillus ampliporus]|nr:hypothetical protein DFH29DRAFT_881794 [Suillus ampliporus]